MIGVYTNLVRVLQALEAGLDALLELLGVAAQLTHLLGEHLHLQHLRQQLHLLRHGLQVPVELPGLAQHRLGNATGGGVTSDLKVT